MQYNAICIVAGVQKLQVFVFWNFLEFFFFPPLSENIWSSVQLVESVDLKTADMKGQLQWLSVAQTGSELCPLHLENVWSMFPEHLVCARPWPRGWRCSRIERGLPALHACLLLSFSPATILGSYLLCSVLECKCLPYTYDSRVAGMASVEALLVAVTGERTWERRSGERRSREGKDEGS